MAHMPSGSHSHDKEALLRRAFHALNHRDFDDLLAVCSPEIEFASVLAASEGRVYQGKAGVHKYFEDLDQAWAEFTAEPIDFMEGRDGAVTVVRTIGRGRASAVPVELRTAVVWTVCGDRIVRGVAYLDLAEALAAAGIDATPCLGPKALLNVHGT